MLEVLCYSWVDPGEHSSLEDSAKYSGSDLLWRIFYGGSSMEDSGVDSAMDSDSDLMMMGSGMDSGLDFETDSSVEDSMEYSGVDSGMDLMKSQKVAISLCV